MAEKCCNTCKWYVHENITDGMVCVNGSSDYCTDFTDEDFCCDEWEKMPDEKREGH